MILFACVAVALAAVAPVKNVQERKDLDTAAGHFLGGINLIYFVIFGSVDYKIVFNIQVLVMVTRSMADFMADSQDLDTDSDFMVKISTGFMTKVLGPTYLRDSMYHYRKNLYVLELM